ncbi:GH3 auxin-responsive promoter family protein, partial [Flavobacteriaceae bacterium]|nr:GH3 auxin-responsive promoter family protein [Flavobacteriaceae bacterium]
MAIPLFNSIASWFLKKRIHQIELFLKYPHEVQQEVLNDLLRISKNTEVGKRYDFNSIRNYQTFKSRVPLVTY